MPLLFVPAAQPGISPALQPYQLRSESGDQVLSVAVNQVSYSTGSYPGFESFSKAAAERIGRALELFEVRRLERVVYRYENEVGVQKAEDGSIAMADVFDIGQAKWATGPLLNADVGITTQPSPGLQQIVRLRTEEVPTGAVIRLTVAALVSPAGEATELSEIIAKAHASAVTCFEAIITDTFREYISGAKE